ncbi:NAD-dependent epimerase/dehydratase family protein [Nannocystis radixulma]|uniref:NAD(P)-dependent oxidoreductase n=1 Tax=Nannocystis radixulma TaxID=2995305 RepID=A0ABT5B3C7_9BACT|nr:NAD(P)-dependent oxidoreductase [Nannocystis radixulma]MDC0667973.1 NAD(P)-dependent oxidoreductase [Nannocystis radixulma]
MNILITGVAGRIGRAIHASLAPAHDLLGLDRRPSPLTDIVSEIDDAVLLQRALRGVDAIVHVAALHAPHVGVLPDREFERINVAATRQLIALAREAGVRRVLYTSTTALYGRASTTPPGRAGWVDEATVPQPITIYHRTKLAAEALLEAAAHEGAFTLRILRMSRCFPEPASLMAAYRLHRGIDARDVAAGHVLALAHDGPATTTFLLSGVSPFEREDAAALATDAPSVLRRRAPDLVAAYVERGWPLPACIDRVYDSTRAQRELGWRPRHGFASVLTQWDARDPEVLAPTAAAVDARVE